MDPKFKTLLSLIAIILFVIAIRDIIKSRLNYSLFNLVWLMIVCVLPIVGPLAYFYSRTGMKVDRPRKFNPNFIRHSPNEIIIDNKA